MIIIGLTGAKECGKTTLAKMLIEEHGFIRVRLADTLKRMLRALGLTEAQVDGADKEIELGMLCGHTPRYAMQTLGTEWGREFIGTDFWAKVCHNQLLLLGSSNPDVRIVVDDLRFPNEAKMLLSMGAHIWRIRRPSVEPQPTLSQAWKLWWNRSGGGGMHTSEYHWRTLPCHYEIQNDGDLALLWQRAEALLPAELRPPRESV